MKICAATGNAGKLRELRRILEAQGHEVVSQKELGITIEPEETGTTFAENALIKAETICKASGLPTIADDSGLCVDALDGAPGVYSARYCGHHGDDEANNDKLLENMKDVPAGQRGAKFVAAVCFILPTGQHLICRGECPGRVAFERLAGDYGFGYDPLFIPDECGVGKTDKRPNSEGRSYAQLTPDEKDAISHRGNALAEMEKELPELERAIDQTVLACTEMSRTRTGVLIVFERKILLDDVVRSGTTLDASVSSELLKNIFFVKAPMHDGAVIIRNGRILGAGCMLPLSKNVNLSRDLGMRHRAGIGMSENSDAVVVIVSEETGSISVAIGGMLKRHLQAETLSQLLHNELMPQQEETDKVRFPLRELLRARRKGAQEDEEE